MRMIDADALEREISVSHTMTDDYGIKTGYEICMRLVEDAPTIEPERKTGRWIPQDHNRRNGYVTTTVYFYPKCSKCGFSGNYVMNYCPSCGAYMGGEQDE